MQIKLKLTRKKQPFRGMGDAFQEKEVTKGSEIRTIMGI